MNSPGSSDDKYVGLLAKFTFYLLLAYVLLLALEHVQGILSMLFISLLVAYVLDPVIDWFEAHRINRSLAIVIFVTLGSTIGIGFALWIIPPLAGELSTAGSRLHAVLEQDQDAIVAWFSQTLGIEISSDFALDLKEKAQAYAPQAVDAASAFMQAAVTKTVSVVGWALNVVFVPIFIFYFLRDFDRMTAWVSEQLPLNHKENILKRAHSVDEIIGHWVRGQVNVALILALLYAAGLGIVGIELGIAIGLLTGLLCVIPYLGVAIGLGLALLMAVLGTNVASSVMGVAIVFTVIQIIEGYILTPRLVGERVGLSAVSVLIVLLVGGELFGFLGFLLAVPVAGAGKTIAVEGLEWYRQSVYFQGEATDGKADD